MNFSEDDVARLVALEREIFPDCWNEKMLRDVLADEKYLVLVERDEGDDIFAYLLGWRIGDEAELARVGVDGERRGQGWGKSLLQRALQFWNEHGAARVFLEVRESNRVARQLYETAGFAIVGRRHNYYENGETALVMELSSL